VGQIDPAQIVEVADGRYIVPFMAQGGTAMAAGLSFIDTTGSVATAAIDEISYGTMPPITVKPVGLVSAALVGGRAVFPITNQQTLGGMLLSYGVRTTSFQLNGADLKLPVILEGKEPTAIASLGGTNVAVVNAAGTAGASLDIVDTSVADPSAAVVGTIPLGVARAVKLPELAQSSDKQYAVVAGEGSPTADGGIDPSAPKKVLIVDVTGRQVSGSVDLLLDLVGGDVRGIAVHGTMAYVSVDDGTNTPSSGRVAVIDFTNPAAPILKGAIVVGHDAGAIAAHAPSGILYVAVSDRSCEAPGTAAVHHAKIVAIDPLIANMIQPGRGDPSHQ
jgi:hypothetical protein